MACTEAMVTVVGKLGALTAVVKTSASR
jgi:hypothetical protein